MNSSSSSSTLPEGSKPSARKGLVDNTMNPVKIAFGELGSVGMVLVFSMIDGLRFWGQVTKITCLKGCTGNTLFTLALPDGSEKSIGWRDSGVKTVRAPTIQEVLSGMVGI